MTIVANDNDDDVTLILRNLFLVTPRSKAHQMMPSTKTLFLYDDRNDDDNDNNDNDCDNTLIHFYRQ